MNLEFLHSEQSICALATPPGRSGVALIRLSGEKSYSIVRSISSSLPVSPESHRLYFCKIHEFEHQDQYIDEVLVSFFAEGRSYTGEESVEISCHGNPVVIKNILNNLIAAGSRAAGAGEFTYRAFKNGKIDLVQAENVLNLIEADSDRSAKLSYKQLSGQLSARLIKLEDRLIFLLANFEASIDFTEEDIEIVNYEEAELSLQGLIDEVSSMIDSYREGRIIRDGLKVAIVGPPNVGKSSILNALINESKAIVSDIPGTTRDVVEATTQIGGVNIHFLDTAGLRVTDDVIEQMGIQKSKQGALDADLVYVVIDPTRDIKQQFSSLVDEIFRKNSYLVINKGDLVNNDKLHEIASQAQNLFMQRIQELGNNDTPDKIASVICSAVVDDGLGEVLDTLTTQVSNIEHSSNSMILQARHFELLLQVRDLLAKASELVKHKDSVEFISAELHDAIYKLHDVLGKRFDDEVMDRVFKEFCIGK